MRFKLLATAVLIVGASAHADEIAQYVSVAQGQDFILTNANNLASLSVTGIPVAFYWATSVNQGTAPISALLSLHATSSSNASLNSNNDVTESGFSGSFDITQAAMPSITLLAGNFGPNATLTANGNSASFSDSTTGNSSNEVTYSSSLLSLSGSSGFSFSLSNFQSPAGTAETLWIAADHFPIAGTFAGNGSFSSFDPASVPEPSTVVLIGFALVTCALFLRGRKLHE